MKVKNLCVVGIQKVWAVNRGTVLSAADARHQEYAVVRKKKPAAMGVLERFFGETTFQNPVTKEHIGTNVWKSQKGDLIAEEVLPFSKVAPKEMLDEDLSMDTIEIMDQLLTEHIEATQPLKEATEEVRKVLEKVRELN